MDQAPATAPTLVQTGLRHFFETLPPRRDPFLEQVQRLATESVNLPSIHKDHKTTNPEYPGRTLTIKKIGDFAQSNAYGHFRPMREAVKAAPPADLPVWFVPLEELLSLPAATAIDRSLALVSALRETGQLSRPKRSGRIIDSFADGGLDNLYSNRQRYRDLELIPEDWVDDMKPGGSKGAALVPIERNLSFYFARIGLARFVLAERIADEFFPDDGGSTDEIALRKAEAEIASLSSLQRRIWVSHSFQASLGDTNLSSVSPGGTGVRTLLRAFHQANAPLHAITDVPGIHRSARAVARDPDLAGVLKPETPERRQALRFMRRLQQFFRLNIATKTAIVAEAIEHRI